MLVDVGVMYYDEANEEFEREYFLDRLIEERPEKEDEIRKTFHKMLEETDGEFYIEDMKCVFKN